MKRYYKVIPKNEEPSRISSSSIDKKEVVAANVTTNVEAQPQVQTKSVNGGDVEHVITDRAYLKACLHIVKYLIRTGVAWNIPEDFLGPSFEGDLFGMLELIGMDKSETAKAVLKNAQEKDQLSLPDIQQDMASVCASEIVREIVKEIGDDVFAVVVDDCGDSEHMSVVVRFVDGKGFVTERFIGILYVENSGSLTKAALETMLSQHGLCISKIRGLGYHGGSSLRCLFDRLRTSIRNENQSAHYVHCFSDQLHMALIGALGFHYMTCEFNGVDRLVKMMRCHYKGADLLRENQASHFADIVGNGWTETDELGISHLAPVNVGDTRWADILLSLVKLFPHVLLVLEKLQDVGSSSGRNEARSLQYDLESFDFVFILHLMAKVLGMMSDLNDMLFSQDQSLLKALELVSITKKQLTEYRDGGWEEFFNEVDSACDKWDFNVPDMNAECTMGWSRNQRPRISNLLHYKLHCFYDILDMQLKELDDRFNDENNELLNCIACLSPCKAFEDFDKKSLLRMTELYPHEFSGTDVAVLSDQFECYIADVRSDARFSGLQGIADLFRKLIQTKKHKAYPSVYLLLKLALVLPIAAPSVGRAFSSTGFVKRQAKKRVFDEYMKNCLVTSVEMDLFGTISDDVIIDRFQSMKFR